MVTWKSGKHEVPAFEITEVKLKGLGPNILKEWAAQSEWLGFCMDLPLSLELVSL